MQIKDHYRTLEIPALAGLTEIKQAYRRLARQYHPDKNPDDTQATQFFQEIQSAYEVLSNHTRRKAYDIELKQAGRYTAFNKDQVVHSAQIVKQTDDLLRYISTMSGRSINYDALTDFILGILNQENIATLVRANNAAYNEQITGNILQSAKGILATRSFSEIAAKLSYLHPHEDSVFRKEIQKEADARKFKEQQNRLVPYASLGIVVLVIVLMYLIVHYR